MDVRCCLMWKANQSWIIFSWGIIRTDQCICRFAVEAIAHTHSSEVLGQVLIRVPPVSLRWWVACGRLFSELALTAFEDERFTALANILKLHFNLTKIDMQDARPAFTGRKMSSALNVLHHHFKTLFYILMYLEKKHINTYVYFMSSL